MTVKMCNAWSVGVVMEHLGVLAQVHFKKIIENIKDAGIGR